MMKLGMGARPWAGLDIGSYSVKLVTLPPGDARARFAEAIIPTAFAADEPPGPAILAGLVDDCMTRAGLPPRGFRGISLGVSGPDVLVKQITLPLMDESEVSGAVRFEARKHLPFDVASLVLDHQVVVRNAAERKIEVLLATVSQSRLDRVLAPLRELGIEADIVDAAPLALSNALSHAMSRESHGEHDAGLLLDIGHGSSWLTLRQRGRAFFSRRLEWGGSHLTRAFAIAQHASPDVAETWKLGANATLAGGGPEAAAGRTAAGVLIEELRRSLAYCGTLVELPASLSLHVTGGTARLAGLPEFLGEQLRMGVSVFTPPGSTDRGVRTPPGGPQFAQAFGLALRAA